MGVAEIQTVELDKSDLARNWDKRALGRVSCHFLVRLENPRMLQQICGTPWAINSVSPRKGSWHCSRDKSLSRGTFMHHRKFSIPALLHHRLTKELSPVSKCPQEGWAYQENILQVHSAATVLMCRDSLCCWTERSGPWRRTVKGVRTKNWTPSK